MILGPFWSDWQDLAKSRDERKQKGRLLPSSGHSDEPLQHRLTMSERYVFYLLQY